MGNIYDCLLSCTNVNDIIIMFRDVHTLLRNRRFHVKIENCEDVVPSAERKRRNGKWVI